MNNQLIKLIDDNGLDKTKSQILLDNFSGYFEMASEWERKASELEITDVSQKAEMKLAREGRLFLKDKRIAVERTRKQLKEASLREGQTIDAIAKVLTNLITPIEKDLEEKEKFAEIQEAKRIEALKDARTRELEPYIEFVPYGLNLGTMDDDNYTKVLSGARLQKQAKEEADKKAEQERVERERKAEQDRIEREKKEAAERERIRLENERLRKENEERERQLADERAKAEAERKAIEEKAKKERELHERELRIEREKQNKLEAERKAEQARLEAERLEAERKAAAEKRAKEEADRRAKNAPDKEKLLTFATQLEKMLYAAPEIKSEEAISILDFAEITLKDAVKYIRINADKL